MARTDTLNNFLTDVADSIREKKGTTDTILASDFDTEIASIETGGGTDEPEKGIVFTDYNENGIPTTIKLIGNISIRQNMFNGVNNLMFINGRYEYGNILNYILKMDFSKYTGLILSGESYIFSYLGAFYPTDAKGITFINFPSRLINSNNTYCFHHSKIENDVLDVFKKDKTVPNNCFNGSLLPNLTSIGDDILTLGKYAFAYATIPKLIIPDSITSIAEYCFNESKELKLNKLPESLNTIGENAFNKCNSITIDKIPDNVTTINSYTFNGCTSISSMNLNKSTTINNYCFQDCTSLETVTFAPNTKVIQLYAFANTAINNVNITSNELKTLGQNVFQGCTKLNNFVLNGASNITTVGANMFYGDTLLKSFIAPNTTMKFAVTMFSKCSSLSKVIIYKFSTAMNNSTATNGIFNECSYLKQIWFGFTDTVTSNHIGRYALSGATSLEKCYIDLPRTTVESLQYYSTRFSNNAVPETCQFICNDDEDWITNEEFANLVVE